MLLMKEDCGGNSKGERRCWEFTGGWEVRIRGSRAVLGGSIDFWSCGSDASEYKLRHEAKARPDMTK